MVDVEYQRVGRYTMLRISPWRGDPSTAQVVTVRGPGPDEETIRDLLDRLGHRGVATVLTAAIAQEDHHPFVDAGFTPYERLALLHRYLRAGDPAKVGNSTHRIRRIGRFRIPEVLEVDAAAFATFTPIWQFDAAAYTEACGATDVSRRRCVRSNGRIVAYAITGRTSTSGFVQRLAVHPGHGDIGIGSALLADAVSWLAQAGTRDVWINTQTDNARAHALYRRHGFEERPGGLTVLRYSTDR
jgi:ribosomal protein S18 acetylase RimI-like enzyme